MFTQGFEKIALTTLNPVGMIADSVESGRKTNEAKAKVHGRVGGTARRAREKHMGHYLLNPHVPGPLAELGHRFSRRVHAAKHEQPIVSNIIPPWISLAMGGKAGEKELNKKAGVHDVADAVTEGVHKASRHAKKHWKKYLAGATVPYAYNVGTAGMEESTKAHKGKAVALGHAVRTAKDIRHNNTAGYVINPSSYGPLSEVSARLSRRHHASAAEHPHRTAAIPFYGAIRGGKAGESKK